MADSFTYTIDDLSGVPSNTVTVSLTITPVNDAPLAVADSFVVAEGATSNLNLANNDSDADDGLDLAGISIISGPFNGSIDAINVDGTVDYTHNGGETLSDSFTYTINDQMGFASNTRTVSIAITPVNDAPLAAADNFVAAEGATARLNLTDNDSDPDDGLDLASIRIVSGPSSGSIDAINADGTVDYTHGGSETLSDSFTYTINDANGLASNTVMVSLTITPVNDTAPPIEPKEPSFAPVELGSAPAEFNPLRTPVSSEFQERVHTQASPFASVAQAIDEGDIQQVETYETTPSGLTTLRPSSATMREAIETDSVNRPGTPPSTDIDKDQLVEVVGRLRERRPVCRMHG